MSPPKDRRPIRQPFQLTVTTRGHDARESPPPYQVADLAASHMIARFTMPDGTIVEVEHRNGELQVRTPEGQIVVEPRHSNTFAVKVQPL